MDLIYVSTRREIANVLQYHLKPVGLEVVLKTDPTGLVTEPERDPLPIVLFDADDFPRHWKALIMHLRSFHSRPDAVFVLITAKGLDPDEAAKASHLGVNGIVTEDLSEKRGILRLIDVLRRYKQIQEKRGATRYAVTETDRVGLAFLHPEAGSLVTGEVAELSVKGLGFLPDKPERCAGLPRGTELRRCSLRVGEAIVTVGCRVVRAGRDLGLELASYGEGAREAVRSYLEGRPERALRAAIEAARTGLHASPGTDPDSAPGQGSSEGGPEPEAAQAAAGRAG